MKVTGDRLTYQLKQCRRAYERGDDVSIGPAELRAMILDLVHQARYIMCVDGRVPAGEEGERLARIAQVET